MLYMYHYQIMQYHIKLSLDSKVHGANMGLIWGPQDPGGPHVDPMNFAILVISYFTLHYSMV